MNDRRLGATLYPIRGLDSATFSFRVLRVRETLPKDNLLPRRLQQWADRLWRRELRCPVYPTTRFGWPGFLVPADAVANMKGGVTIHGVPDRDYHIDLTDIVHEVPLEKGTPAERDLICRMLERPFSLRLSEKRDLFWRAEWTLFFFLTPVNQSNPQDSMNAFRGLKFGVVLLAGATAYLGVDVRTRYVGRRSLAEYPPEERDAVLHDHLDITLNTDERSYFLRDNGSVKIACRYAGETGKTVSEFEFEPGRTVSDYYAGRYPDLHVDAEDSAVFVKDRTTDEIAKPVPASRLFPIFTTEFSGVRLCSVRPWMSPVERHRTIIDFLQHLRGVRYEKSDLSVEGEIFSAERTVFIPPTLEFGQGRSLSAFPQGLAPKGSEQFDREVVRWASKKYPTLLEAGPHHNEPLPDVALLYPENLPREVRETFIRDMKREVSLQTGQDLRLVQQVSYRIGAGERMGGALLRKAADIKPLPGRHLALVVLSDNFAQTVHGELKDQIRPTLSQCVMERTVRAIASRRNPRRATSQVRNLALAILTEAGVKPWVLAETLHHDLHIGIDLLHGRVGYHFLYGTGGRLVLRRFGQAAARGRMHEAIKGPALQSQLEQTIREICGSGHKVNSIVIHRDGRWWPSESKGLRLALERLKEDKVLEPTARCAVVEIRKNHMPIRLLTKSGGEPNPLLQNPLPGTYLILDESRVLLTTTGRPGVWDRPDGRTAGTLLLQIAEQTGQFRLEEVAEDAYRLTHLNWSSPDIEISLPVTIRWTDEALRETLRPEPGEEEERTDLSEEDLGQDVQD